MNDTLSLLFGLLSPFLGTAIGASMVFLLKKEINPKVKKLLLEYVLRIISSLLLVWVLVISLILLN